jgi:hypothetical protein
MIWPDANPSFDTSGAGMANTYFTAIQTLYVSYFGRPADPAGLAYWETMVEADHGSTAAVAAAFAGTDEYKTSHAGMDSYHVIAETYQNLFGRAPDAAGLQYWGAALAQGSVSVDAAIGAIAAGAQGRDLKILDNKVAAASAFTADLDTAQEVLGYSGAAANQRAKAFLALITDTPWAGITDPIARIAVIDTVIGPPPAGDVHDAGAQAGIVGVPAALPDAGWHGV